MSVWSFEKLTLTAAFDELSNVVLQSLLFFHGSHTRSTAPASSIMPPSILASPIVQSIQNCLQARAARQKEQSSDDSALSANQNVENKPMNGLEIESVGAVVDATASMTSSRRRNQFVLSKPAKFVIVYSMVQMNRRE